MAAAAPAEVCVSIASGADVLAARKRVRALATELGFQPCEGTMLATAVSELARNILQYAKQGEIELRVVRNGEHHGVAITARDAGPGMSDTALALEPGYSTSGGLGLGLPGVRRLSDDFQITSSPGRGTTVRLFKWRHR